MASYAESTLTPSEVIVASARYHWIIFRWSILFLILAALLGYESMFPYSYGSESGQSPTFTSLFGWANLICLALAIILAIPPLVRRGSTEICATNHRIILKSGVIRSHTRELMLRNIQSMDVDQSIPGRIFGYGSINCKAGEGVQAFERLHDIARPNAFVAAITGA